MGIKRFSGGPAMKLKQYLSPALTITLGLFLGAWLLQWGAFSYLSGLGQKQLNQTTQKLKIQIAKNLGYQLSLALAAGDDLAALGTLKTARSHFPQLQKAEIFKSNGHVLLHSDPGMIGKKTKAYPGPRPVSPELTHARQEGRRFTVLLVPLPDEEDLYLRAFFDETLSVQAKKSFAVRFHLLILATSLLIGLFSYFRLSRLEILDPRERARSGIISPAEQASQNNRRCAELLLSEMRHAVVAISRDNKILAANTLALGLLNCRPEELAGMHVMQAPLPAPLLELYQQAIAAPERPTQSRLSLNPKEPGLAVKISCAPASPEWELALVSLG